MQVQVGGGPFHQHMDHLPEQPEGAGHYQHPDHYSKDRIGDVPTEGQHQYRRGHHRHRAQQVGDHVPESALHVQALLRRAVQDPGGGHVDHQAGGAHHQHQSAVDLRRVAEAAGGFEEDPGGDEPQTQGVQHGGQDLGSVEAEGLLDGGGAAGDPDGQQRQADGGAVGEHMAGVGQQGQAAGHQAANHLGHHVPHDQRQGDAKTAPAGGAVAVAVFSSRGGGVLGIVHEYIGPRPGYFPRYLWGFSGHGRGTYLQTRGPA